MMTFEICPKDEVSEAVLILVKYSPHFAHVRDPVVIFGT
jgi:hypothetical protein